MTRQFWKICLTKMDIYHGVIYHGVIYHATFITFSIFQSSRHPKIAFVVYDAALVILRDELLTCGLWRR